MFTADQARSIPAQAAFQKELVDAETRIRNLCATLTPSELSYHRKIGVLIQATAQDQMKAAFTQRGFHAVATDDGFLRIYW
jgi:hypothetical protein